MTMTEPRTANLVDAPFADATPQMLTDMAHHLASLGIRAAVDGDTVTVSIMLASGQFLEGGHVPIDGATYSDVVTRILDVAENTAATFSTVYAPIP